MQSPKRRRSTKTTKKRQTSKEDAFRLKAEPLLEALDSAIFQVLIGPGKKISESLGDSRMVTWWGHRDSNPGPTD